MTTIIDYDINEQKNIINNAIKNGFGKDWYCRAQIQSVYVITDDDYVILNVYYGEPNSIYLMTVQFSKFKILFPKKNYKEEISDKNTK